MTERHPSRPLPATVALGALAVSAVLVLVLTVAPTGIDPVAEVVSNYAHHAFAGPVFVAAVLLFAVGGVAAFATLPRHPVATALMSLWAVAAVLLLVFRTDWGMNEETVSDEIHRVAGVVLLIAMPVAAWLLAPAMATRATAVRCLSVLALTATALFTVSQVGPAALRDLLGLLERVALGAEVVALLLIAGTARTGSI